MAGKVRLAAKHLIAGDYFRFRYSRWLLCGALLAVAVSSPPRCNAQGSPEIIGRIDGLDFSVESPPGAQPVSGELAAHLASGGRVAVRSGQARVTLQDGSEILICGAARMQFLKAQDSLTIALDYGVVRVHAEGSLPIAVYTPLVVATTVAIGGGARDATIGLDQAGKMCIRAATGAVRVQQQFGDQTLLVPQSGALTLADAQVSPILPAASDCACNLDAAKLFPPHLEVTTGAISLPGSKTGARPAPSGISSNTPIVPPPVANPKGSSNAEAVAPPSVEEPIYKILMPALRFDASAPDPPPDASAETFLLVRTAVVHSEVVYRGTIVPGKKKETLTVAAQANPPNASTQGKPGFFAKIGGFFRRIFGG